MELIAFSVFAVVVLFGILGLVFDPEFPLLSSVFALTILIFIAVVIVSAKESHTKIKQFEKKCTEVNKGIPVAGYCMKKETVIERMQ